METIEVCGYVHAPVEQVWAALTEHERYDRFEGVNGVRLVKEGSPHRNGVGAERRLEVPGGALVERIERFDEPECMEYRIIESTLPIDHDGGRIRLTARGDGTEVHWVSRFTIPVPLVGRAAGALFRLVLTDGFTAMLRQVKGELEAA